MAEMKVPFLIKNEVVGDTTVLTLSGRIEKASWWSGEDCISANLIRQQLEDVKTPVTIKLNSPGGDVFEGIEIYNFLKSHESDITVEVTAIAGSAATFICMGADKVVMDVGATMMIHQASSIAFGNKDDLQKVINALETIDESIVTIYEERTGLSKEEITNLIKAETWFTAEEAVKKGFADEYKQKMEKVENKAPVFTNTQKLKLKLYGGK